MITKPHKDQIDQLLEDTFPSDRRDAGPEAHRRDACATHLPTRPPDGETAGAGTTAELPASQDSARAATAPAALAIGGTPGRRPTGGTPAPPGTGCPTLMPRADQLVELGRMRECVALLKEEIEAGWQRIIAEQQRLGWPDFDKIQDATHALHRATMDLDGTAYEMVIKMGWGGPRR